jgi:hypothetical protein|tara:strand:+ start:496 stop:711 length:216 start_codon:yes stop_codon:yes gene_type:complete
MNDTGKMIWKIDSIISYVVEREMEGQIDKEDSWYPLIELLEDLNEKIKDEERFVEKTSKRILDSIKQEGKL